jgi:hypothetical protein
MHCSFIRQNILYRKKRTQKILLDAGKEEAGLEAKQRQVYVCAWTP